MADVGPVGDAVPEGDVAVDEADAWAEAVQGAGAGGGAGDAIVAPPASDSPVPADDEEEDEIEPEELPVVKGKGEKKKKQGPKVKATPSRQSTRPTRSPAIIKSAATPTPKRVRALPSVKVPPSTTSKSSKKAAPVSRKSPKKKGHQSEAGKVVAKSKRK